MWHSVGLRIHGGSPWLSRALAGLFLLLAGLTAGWAAARYGLLVSLGALAGPALSMAGFFFPWAGLLLSTAIAVLLPFGVLPLSLGLTPSYLELTLAGTLAGWFLPPLASGRRRWRFATLDALAWAFIALFLFALLMGLGRGVQATVLHNAAKVLLGLLAFFGVRNMADSEKRMRHLLALFLLAAGLAAFLGLAFRALPDRTAEYLLVRMGPLGYPTTGRVLRYVEDDPRGLERAIGTAVDPNSFGGMLALAAAVTLGELLNRPAQTGRPGREKKAPSPGPQLTGRESPPASKRRPGGDMIPPLFPRPLLPHPLLGGLLALLVLCLYLTYSRAALGGFLVAALFLAAARYRRLWWVLLVAAVVVAALVAGLGGDNPQVERFRQGLAFQDLAPRMRLEEFANAAAIVRRYPVWGVGWGNAPDADLVTGVSSLYLTVAERMGVSGLVALAAFVGMALAQAWRRRRTEERAAALPDPGLPGHRLALLAGVVAALATGLLDHYFLNLEFPHMAALLWITLGLATADVPPPQLAP